MSQFESVYFIGTHGLASWTLRFARNHDILGGTIFLGKGTAKNFWLNLFELNHTDKEILVMVAQRGYAFRLMQLLKDELSLNKPNHGIAFSIPVTSYTGGVREEDLEYEKEDDGTMYNAITVVVNKGKAEDALEAAQSAGATGGTIINARGAGRNETCKLFMMDIEPEKELLLIIVERDKTEAITAAVKERMSLEKQGKGVLFVQEISQVIGLYEQK